MHFSSVYFACLTLLLSNLPSAFMQTNLVHNVMPIYFMNIGFICFNCLLTLNVYILWESSVLQVPVKTISKYCHPLQSFTIW